MAITFQQASKKQSRLRAAVFGPSGAGKTYSCLRIAAGIGGRVALIDTEHGSASKYADRFTFDTAQLADRTIDGYVEAIKSARDYDVLIIDSLSHGWQELLEQVEKLAQAKYRGYTWSAWSEGTPKQRQLIEAILAYPGHLLATIRSKTEWTTASDDRGKSRPVRVGLAPEQGKGIEYEFDLLLEMTTEHVARIIKDRTGKFQDQLIEKPDESFGTALRNWLQEGTEPAPAATATGPDLSALNALIAQHGIAEAQQKAWLEHFKVGSLGELSQDRIDAIVAKIRKTIEGGTK